MTITRTIDKVLFNLVVFDGEVEPEEYLSAAQAGNHHYHDGVFSLAKWPVTDEDFDIVDTSSTWTPIGYLDVEIPADVAEVEIQIWGTHVPAAADKVEVRIVEDPFGSPSALTTQTLPTSSAGLPLSAVVSVSDGVNVLGVEVWSDSAVDGVLDQIVVLAEVL